MIIKVLAPLFSVPIGPKNIVIHELIGLGVVIVNHSDPSLIGLRGTIVDETLKTLLLETDRGKKRVPKKGGIFCFRLPDGRWTLVRGEEILFRPWERTKRGYKAFLRRRPKVFEGPCVEI